MSTARSRPVWAHPAGRIVLVGGVAAGLVLGVSRVGAAPNAEPPVETGDRVAASLTTSYCPGNPFAGADEGAPEDDLDGGVRAQAAPAEVLEGLIRPSDEPGTITVEELTGPPTDRQTGAPESGPTSEAVDGLGARSVRVRGTAERAPGLAATQAFTAAGQQVRGLAAVPCGAPTADAWLVAGGGEKGRQERLVLTNPGGNPVNVRLDVVGTDSGDTGEGGSADRSVVVPAHDRSVILLDAIGGTQDPQAVHVTTTGGLVVPVIADHHLDGLVPAGVETAGPTAAPAKRLVLPGTASTRARGVVVAVPGDRDAVVQVRRLSDGPARGVEVATVPAGDVADITLPETPGTRGWVVEADEPVVAAAHTTTQDSRGRSDMAWSVATPAFGGLGAAVLPQTSGLRRLVQVSAADGPAEVEVHLLEDGELRTERLDLEQDRAGEVDAGEATAVWVRPVSGRVHAAALLMGRDGGSLAEATSVPILPSRVAVRDVPVTRVG